MEIPRQQAIDLLKSWKQKGSTVGLHFAARGGTAGSTMLAKVAEVSSRIVFKNESSVLQFALYKARFAYGPVRTFLQPSREGSVELAGLHIWLESGHWLIICDAEGLGPEWLQGTSIRRALKGTGGTFKSQSERELALQNN
jgi:hypothetical protein